MGMSQSQCALGFLCYADQHEWQHSWKCSENGCRSFYKHELHHENDMTPGLLRVASFIASTCDTFGPLRGMRAITR